VAARVLRAAEVAKDERLRWRAVTTLEDFRYRVDGPGSVDLESVELAAERLPAGQERGDALLLLGMVTRDRGRLDEAAEWLRKADEVYTQIGAAGSHASALNALANLCLQRNRLSEAEGLFAEAARISGAEGRRNNAAVSEINRALCAFRRGALEGLVTRLEPSVRSLVLAGANDMAWQAVVIVGEVLLASGDAVGAARRLGEAVEQMRRTSFREGVAEAALLLAHVTAMRGDLEAAAGHLDEARRTTEALGDPRKQIQLAGLEAQVACFACDLAGATAAARRAVALAQSIASGEARVSLALRLAECAAFGLPAEAVAATDALLSTGAGESGTVALVAAEALAGAKALADEHGAADGIRRGAAAFRDPSVGERHAERAAVAAYMEATAAARERRVDRAEDAVRDGLTRADRLGHVWLSLRLHALRGRLAADEPGRARARADVEKVASRLPSPAARDRVLRLYDA
jgi:tetratricopeptide (TPR) repeat protein